jgi:hypothetical protein
VLNACHSAEISGAVDATGASGACHSLAARLVAFGVPLVIGMTGEVADGACRLFTQSFYRALISGSCLVLAAARGRRAAMLHYASYLNDAEWTRPTVFARGQTQFPINAAAAPMASLAGALGRYRKSSAPLFDRIDCLSQYAQFRNEAHAFCSKHAQGKVDPGPREVVLAFGVEEDEGHDQKLGRLRFGKTPLFEDVAAQAVLDGFVPCVLPSGETEPPENLGDFALRVTEAMDEARDCFALKRRGQFEVLTVVAMLCKLAPPSPTATPVERLQAVRELRQKLKQIGDMGRDEARVLKAALASDFSKLREDFQNERHPVVIIDDFHRYEGVLAPLREHVLDVYGFGGDLPQGSRIVVPLIFTHSVRSAVGRGAEEIKKLLNGMPKAVRRVPLGKLGLAELRLALSNCLLAMQPPVAVSTDRKIKPQVEGFFAAVSKTAQGVPSVFLSERVQGMVEYAKENRCLIEASEEVIFDSLKKRN